MQKRLALAYPKGSAEYVIMHGLWQKSRKRNPSESYGGIRNPRLAFEAAIADLLSLEPIAGDHVKRVAARMATAIGIMTRVERGLESIVVKFNDDYLFAIPGDTAIAIHRRWLFETELKKREWRESEEGRRYRQETEEKRRYYKRACRAHIAAMKRLDFQNLKEVIDWLLVLSDVACMDAWVPADMILAFFANHGHYPSQNTDGDFNLYDARNFAGWAIGAQLACLEVAGVPYHNFDIFANAWQERCMALQPIAATA